MEQHPETYPRHAMSLVREALEDTPVVVVQGDRQVGKCTLAQLATDRMETHVVTMDDPDSRALAADDPQFFVEQAGEGTLLVDEAQRAPDLVLPVKASVDRVRRIGRFPLTGSADLQQVKGVGSSLAGRAETVELMTLSQGESNFMSGLPRLLAAQGQSELVKAKEARTSGISETTFDSYLRLAQVMRLVASTPPWRCAPRSRLSKRPKVSLTDTGLAAHLAGFTSPMAPTVGGREFHGALIEQFVVLELSDGRLIAIEVKSARSVNERSWTALKQFRDQVKDREVIGIVPHTGTQVAHLNDWLYVLSISSLWEHPTT